MNNRKRKKRRKGIKESNSMEKAMKKEGEKNREEREGKGMGRQGDRYFFRFF